MVEKYIAPDTVVDWIRNSLKGHKGGSIIWKAVNKSFDVIEDNLIWKVGNGRSVQVGIDLWIGCNERYRLSEPLVISLR